MTVRVLFLSVLKDLAGPGEVSLELPTGATVADVLEECFSRWPKLREWDASLLVAVDQSYAKRSTAVTENAEIAIMPPVQGG